MHYYLIVCLAFCSYFSFSLNAVGEEREGDDIDVFELDTDNFKTANDDFVSVKMKESVDCVDFHVSRGWCCGEEVISVEKDLLEIHWRETCELLGLKEVPSLEDLEDFKVPRMKSSAIKRLASLLEDIHKYRVKEGSKELELKKLEQDFISYLLRNPRELQKLLPLFEGCLPEEHIKIVANHTISKCAVAMFVIPIVAMFYVLTSLFFDNSENDSSLFFNSATVGPFIVAMVIWLYFLWKIKDMSIVCEFVNDPSSRYESQPLLGY